jgi:hypothetical protein
MDFLELSSFSQYEYLAASSISQYGVRTADEIKLEMES